MAANKNTGQDFEFWRSSFGSLQNLIELDKVKSSRKKVTWLYFYAFLTGALSLVAIFFSFYLSNAFLLNVVLVSGAIALVLFALAYTKSQKQMDEIEEVLKLAQCQQFALDNHAIVSVTNLKGRIVYVNDRFIETSGYSRDELIGQTHSLVNSSYHDASFFKELWQQITQGETWRGEVRNQAKDGSYYWVSSMVMPIRNHRGEITHYISIRTDITHQKQVEADLAKAVEKAMAASQAKSEFLANMSHEIRTPMNGVLGMLQLIEEEPLNEASQDYVQTALGSGRALLRILNDILDVSKIEAGKLDLEHHMFDWPKFFKETLSSIELQAKQKGLNFRIDVDPNIPQSLCGDETRIGQILINLAGNALKFTEKGEVAVSCRLVAERQDDVEVEIEVSDSGVGMTEAQQNSIFHAFSQADMSINRRFGGTGLGLTISQSLAHIMGGKIWVQSQFGQGTQFFVRIPVDKKMQCLDGISEKEMDNEIASLEQVRILLVEDNQVNQKLALALLRKRHADSVDLAENGQEAVEKYQAALSSSRPYDLVLMDMQMPVMDGIKATQLIRDYEEEFSQDTVPIMALTANASEKDQMDCYQNGMNGFVGKPFNKDVFYQEIDRLLFIK